MADRLAPPDHAYELWRHWDKPSVAWYQGGHISYLWQVEVRRIILDALTSAGMVTRKTLELAATTA